MSHHSYLISRELAATDPPFSALIMAAMRKADNHNLALLQRGWPELWIELQERYWTPGELTAEEISYDGPERSQP